MAFRGEPYKRCTLTKQELIDIAKEELQKQADAYERWSNTTREDLINLLIESYTTNYKQVLNEMSLELKAQINSLETLNNSELYALLPSLTFYYDDENLYQALEGIDDRYSGYLWRGGSEKACYSFLETATYVLFSDGIDCDLKRVKQFWIDYPDGVIYA